MFNVTGAYLVTVIVTVVAFLLKVVVQIVRVVVLPVTLVILPAINVIVVVSLITVLQVVTLIVMIVKQGRIVLLCVGHIVRIVTVAIPALTELAQEDIVQADRELALLV
jgi:hypothetical protein